MCNGKQPRKCSGKTETRGRNCTVLILLRDRKCSGASWLLDVWLLDAVQQPHVQQPYTYAKSEVTSAVLGNLMMGGVSPETC